MESDTKLTSSSTWLWDPAEKFDSALELSHYHGYNGDSGYLHSASSPTFRNRVLSSLGQGHGHGDGCGTLDILIPFLIILDFSLWVLFMYELGHTTCLSLPMRWDTNFDLLVGMGYVAVTLEVAYGIHHAELWHISRRWAHLLWHISRRWAHLVQMFCLTWGITNLTVIVLFILYTFNGDFLLGIIVGIKMTILSIHLIEVFSSFANRKTERVCCLRQWVGDGQVLLVGAIAMVVILTLSLRDYDEHGYVQSFVAIPASLLEVQRTEHGASYVYPYFTLTCTYSVIFDVVSRDDVVTFTNTDPSSKRFGCTQERLLRDVWKEPISELCGQTLNLAFDSCSLAAKIDNGPNEFEMSGQMRLAIALTTEILIWITLARSMTLLTTEKRFLHAFWVIVLVATLVAGILLWVQDEDDHSTHAHSSSFKGY
eukprot:g61269.t1